MSWIQLRIHSDPKQVEIIEALLLETGALSITLQDGADQPILEPELGTMPIWDSTHIVGLYTIIDTVVSDIIQYIETQLRDIHHVTLPYYKVELVEDKDWVRAWMDDFHPMKFGNKLWVCPSWCEPTEPDAVNLILDPGLAFGTGTHPTTSLCLQWLDSHISEDEVVIDYGCGSGILGIAALLLGAKKMIGIDNDPQAITATKDNAHRNQIRTEQYDVYFPDQYTSPHSNITIANILAGPLITLCDKISGITKPGGKLALSGLLLEQADEVQKVYQQHFDMVTPIHMDGWVLLSGVKR
jgi:ribosomal protein L11 methyltransferase